MLHSQFNSFVVDGAAFLETVTVNLQQNCSKVIIIAWNCDWWHENIRLHNGKADNGKYISFDVQFRKIRLPLPLGIVKSILIFTPIWNALQHLDFINVPFPSNVSSASKTFCHFDVFTKVFIATIFCL